MLFSLKNFANFNFWGELEVVIIGDTFSVGLAISTALEGSTLVDQISPTNRTLIATMKPLKNIGSLLSNFAPIIEIIKIENDKIAESIQKKQYAPILKNIIFINKKLNVDDPQDIKNTNHHRNLFSFSFGEIKLRESVIVITNIDKYVINPANERGILT